MARQHNQIVGCWVIYTDDPKVIVLDAYLRATVCALVHFNSSYTKESSIPLRYLKPVQ